MERMFRVIDVRSRHAMFSIVEDRRAARAQIEADYPAELRDAALEALGDGANVETAAQLFAARCTTECQDRLRASIAAPTSDRADGNEQVVQTARGTIRLYREDDAHWWGIVWRTAELDDERNRASRDRRQIESNAETYRTRRELR